MDNPVLVVLETRGGGGDMRQLLVMIENG